MNRALRVIQDSSFILQVQFAFYSQQDKWDAAISVTPQVEMDARPRARQD